MIFKPMKSKQPFIAITVSFSIRYILLFTMILFPLLNACSHKLQNTTGTGEAEYITESDFLFNTTVTIHLYDKQDTNILNGCFELMKKYETICSRTDENSELYTLNHRKSAQIDDSYLISDELSALLQSGFYYSCLSDGAFDLTIGAVSTLWNISPSSPVIPEDSKLKAALKHVNYHSVLLEPNRISFASDGILLDLGAIAKGFIADCVKEYLIDNGVHSALINLGGNILCVGNKPDGTGFRVGVQKPFADHNETIAVLDITDQSVVSSGIYERYFESEGTLYHHILNPRSGYPCANNLTSVTIISKQSVDGDGLSTACFALGLEKGLALIESLPNTYAVFITSDNQIYYSQGLETAVSILSE